MSEGMKVVGFWVLLYEV